jgi:hypothetical protein
VTVTGPGELEPGFKFAQASKTLADWDRDSDSDSDSDRRTRTRSRTESDPPGGWDIRVRLGVDDSESDIGSASLSKA